MQANLTRTCAACGTALLGGVCPCCLVDPAQAPSVVGFRPIWEDLGEATGAIRLIGDYVPVSLVGEGGAGRVYRATQLTTGRTVALKVMRDAASPRRVQREIAALAALNHPGIVQVWDAGEHEGTAYLAMEWVEGANLGERMSQRPFQPRESAEIIARAAHALEHAHERGVLHRDLKPQNILLDAHNVPRLTDFGLARLLSEEGTRVTRTNAAIGTPSYMAPEQVDGERGPESPRTDVYGLGATFYHLLTGVPPFRASSIETTLRQVLEHEPPPPRLLNVDVPQDLETICLGCLEKAPTRRYASAGELANELERFLRHEPIRRRPIGRLGRTLKWCQRKPLLASLSAALSVAVIAGTTSVAWQARRTQFANVNLAGTVGELRMRQAESLFAENRPGDAIALLAQQIRQFPNVRPPIARLVAALIRRGFPVPVAQLGPTSGQVTSLHWHPDGERILVVAQAGVQEAWAMELWSTHSATRLGGPRHLGQTEGTAAFSPDGTFLLTTFDGAVQLWRTDSLAPSGDAFTMVASGTAAAWHPDSRRFATINPKGRVVVVTCDRSQPEWEVPHTNQAAAFAFSADGTQLVVGDQDGDVDVWNLPSRQRVVDPLQHPGPIVSLDVSSTGTRLAVTYRTSHEDSESHSFSLWALPEARPLPIAAPGALRARLPFYSSFSPDGTALLITDEFTQATLIEHNTGMILAHLPRHAVNRHGWFSAAERAVAGAEDATDLALFDMRTGAPLLLPIHSTWPYEAVQLSPDGTRLAASAGRTEVGVWHTGRTKARPIEFPDGGGCVAFSRDGLNLLTGNRAGLAHLFSLPTGHRIAGPWKHRGRMTAVALNPNGQQALCATEAGDVRLWSLANPLAPPLQLDPLGGVSAAGYAANGEIVATLTSEGTLRFWRARDGQPITPPIDVHRGLPFQFSNATRSLAVHPQGMSIAVAAYTGQATVWEVGTTNRQLVLPHVRPVHAIQYNRSGDSIATACFDHYVRVWSSRSGRLLTPPLQHSREAICLDFSPDGQLIASAGQDGVALVWRLSDGKLVARGEGHQAQIVDLRFSPDGTRFATFAQDGTARLWDTRTAASLDEAYPGLDVAAGRIAWNPDGRLLAVAPFAGPLRLHPVLLPPVPAPTWLADLGDAVAGRTQEVSPLAAWLRLRALTARLPADDFSARWAQELFTPEIPTSRTSDAD